MASILVELSVHAAVGVMTPFEPNVCDCALWVSDWVMMRIGKDPAASYRGKYIGRPIAWARRDRDNGGAVGIFDRFAQDVGLGEIDTQDARPGDVGALIVNASRRPGVLRPRPALAIRGASSWLAKIGHGLWRLDDNMAIRAWRID
jgi:hypothetical protein